MHLTIITVDADGETHFADAAIALDEQPFAPPAPPLEVSAPVPSVRGVFFRFPPGWVGDWHPTPCRQYYVQATGVIEAEVSDGEVRRFRAGDVVLLEDLHGQGHVTRVVGDDVVSGVFLQLPD